MLAAPPTSQDGNGLSTSDPSAGQTHCCVEHLGLVVSGHATAEMQTGVVHHLTAGTLFYIPAEPHDSWVVGDQPYISLHFIGADKYTR